MSTATAIVPIRVPFHEDEIFCDVGGGVVAMNPTCEAMGIGFESQLKRLKRAHWAKSSMVMMTMVAADGRGREMTFVPRKVFSLWLATIDTNRIKDRAVREKVERYQLEAADVLDRHFFGVPIAPAVEIPYADRPWSVRFRETMLPHVRHVNEFHPGCFTVLTTLGTPMLAMEDELVRHMFAVGPSDRPDVSIGLCWANYRRSLGWAPSERTAPLWLIDQERWVDLRVYENSERGECESWFAREYLTSKLPNYISHKPSFKAHGALPAASAAENICMSLSGHHASLKAPLRAALDAYGGFFPASLPAGVERRRLA